MNFITERLRNRPLSREALLSAVVRMGGLLMSFVLMAFLARTLGVENYGAYTFVLTLIFLLEVPAAFGLPTWSMREIASARGREQTGRIFPLVKKAVLVVLGAGAIISICATVLTTTLPLFSNRTVEFTFLAALVVLVLGVLNQLSGSFLQGFGVVWKAQLVGQVLRPLLIVLFSVIVIAVIPSAWSAPLAMLCHIAAIAVVLAISGLWSFQLVTPLKQAPREPVEDVATLLRLGAPFMLLTAMQYLQTRIDILLIGIMLDEASVGLYQVAARTASLVYFPISALLIVMAPEFARLNARGETTRLQRLLTKSARASLVLAIPVALLFVFLGGTLIRSVFGIEFGPAAPALAILAVAQLLVVAAGPGSQVLIVAGAQKALTGLVMSTALLNTGLNIVLINEMGIEGAAWATAISAVVRTAGIIILCQYRTGLVAHPLFGLFQRSGARP